MIIKKNKDYDTIVNVDSSNSDDNADNPVIVHINTQLFQHATELLHTEIKLKTKQRFSPTNLLNGIFQKFKIEKIENSQYWNNYVNKCISFIEHLVSMEVKKESFEVPKSFINEDFSERFLFRQLIKLQLILALHRLFCFNLKTTL